MNTAVLKSFATGARADLLKEVGARVAVVLAENSLARIESASAVRALENAIGRDGREQVIERVAYTWFNRMIAIRFMDANGYTGSGIVSPEPGRGSGQPEVLAEAKAGTFDSAVVATKAQETITALLNGTRPSQDPQGEAYGLLLEAYCRNWHRAMPFMFEQEGDYTELLIPTALLAADSVRERAVQTLTEDVCREVEVIGWLYQFYISERKAEVFEGFKKNKKAGAAEIPAATQLFTPHWIVRYLVENSLGRLWLLNNPSSRLAKQMDYYIKPVDEETDFLKIAKPEELKVMDPAVGSGHMLTYAFDLLYAIYTERGYDPVEIPTLILQHNLYGTEIDPRASALAAFALTMKAVAKRRLFLKNPVQPNVRVLENIHFDPDELDYLWSITKSASINRADADEFWNVFEHADTYGSLIQPNVDLDGRLRVALSTAEDAGDLLGNKVHRKCSRVLDQAGYLSVKYSVVIANPPYMGAGNIGPLLGEFLAANFKPEKADVFSAFISRMLRLAADKGLVGLMSPNVWMYIASHQKLRQLILREKTLLSLIELPLGGFRDATVQIAACTLRAAQASKQRGAYIDLTRAEPARVASGDALRDALSAEVQYRSQREFDAIPGGPIAHGLPKHAVFAYANGARLGEFTYGQPGLQTSNNARFVRFWWEVSRNRTGLEIPSSEAAVQSGLRWFPYLKGGDYRRWFGNEWSVVDWENNGLRIKSYVNERYPYLKGNIDYVVKDRGYYFRPMISYTKIGSGRFAARLSGTGYLFDVAGSAVFPSAELAPVVLGFLNSRVGEMFLRAQNPTLNVQAGDIDRLPLARARAESMRDEVDPVVSQLVELSEQEWATHETSLTFDPSLQKADETDARLAELAQAIQGEDLRRAGTARELEKIVDEAFAVAFGLPNADATKLPPAGPSVRIRGGRDVTSELISYSVGCMFGRYSLDGPGLILADQGSALEDYLARVPSPSFMPDADNVIPIVDGDWFEDDIVARFRQFLRAAFGDEHFEENLRFVTESLGVKDLRDYFVRSFYDDHVKRYKKRPIYWLFRSPKGSFSALIYLHRYSPSTASTVLTGYLREFIGKLEANLEHQGRVATGMGGASAREVAAAIKEADRIRKVLVELRDYEHDVLFPLAGQQIALDLDDGVLVNYQKLGSALKDIGLKKGGSNE